MLAKGTNQLDVVYRERMSKRDLKVFKPTAAPPSFSNPLTAMMQSRATRQPTMHRASTSQVQFKPFTSVSSYRSTRHHSLRVRAAADTTAAVDSTPLWTELGESCAAFKKAPLSMVRITTVGRSM